MIVVLLAPLLAVALAGCGSDPAPPRSSSSASPLPSPSPGATAERWIAVVAVANDPDRLDAMTERLRSLGTALVVSPTDCLEGLPDEAGSGYLIGAVGDSRAEVEGLVVDAGEDVAFTAHVLNVCTD